MNTNNANIIPFNQPLFLGSPVMTNQGDLSLGYLEGLHSTLVKATNAHSRTLGIRFELLFPQDGIINEERIDGCISKFVEALKYQIKVANSKCMPCGRPVHASDVRYVWVREQDSSVSPHYHFLLLLNRDAFHTLGKFEVGRDNLFNRIRKAWNTALGLMPQMDYQYIYIPQNSTYHVNDSSGFSDLFYRASYLCKLRTKHLSKHHDSFGSSRI